MKLDMLVVFIDPGLDEISILCNLCFLTLAEKHMIVKMKVACSSEMLYPPVRVCGVTTKKTTV
jgi:hypothetical protein